MTAQRPTGPIPWRVKTRVNRATWLGPAMTEAEAVQAAAAAAEQLRNIGDGGQMMLVPTRYGVDAWVRGRDIVSIEPVGPRWDGLDDNDRPDAATSAPDAAQPDPPADDRVPTALLTTGGLVAVSPAPGLDGTSWLQMRNRQAQGRPRGKR